MWWNAARELPALAIENGMGYEPHRRPQVPASDMTMPEDTHDMAIRADARAGEALRRIDHHEEECVRFRGEIKAAIDQFNKRWWAVAGTLILILLAIIGVLVAPVFTG
jgi:hypothetical protein